MRKTPSPFFDQPSMLNGTSTQTKFSQRHYKTNLLVSSLGELKGDVAAGETAVDLSIGVDTVVDASTLLLVKDDLEDLAAVLLGADALADNLNGVAEIGEDGIVDSSQSAGAGTLLLLGVARAGRALGAGQDAARGEDQDMAVGELLLELTGQAAVIELVPGEAWKFLDWVIVLPLLNAVEALQGGDGDKDGNSLLAVANFDLESDLKSACELQDISLGPLPVLFLWKSIATMVFFFRIVPCPKCRRRVYAQLFESGKISIRLPVGKTQWNRTANLGEGVQSCRSTIVENRLFGEQDIEKSVANFVAS